MTTRTGCTVCCAHWPRRGRARTRRWMYHRTCHEPLTATAVVSFMLHTPTFPRSVAYCLRAARESICALPRTQFTIPAADQVLATLAAFEPAVATPWGMHQMADALQKSISHLHQRLEAAYFRRACREHDAASG